jgi:hypothetical protein
VKFKDAVEKTVGLEGAWHGGLQAMPAADRQHVDAEDARRLTGSANVDAALAERHPNDPRWDYAVGHSPTNRRGEVVYWIEIHPASNREINVVLGKLTWLKSWMKNSAPRLQAMEKVFVWVSIGKTSFTLSSPQQKRFALLGLRHKGRVFKIPNEAIA